MQYREDWRDHSDGANGTLEGSVSESIGFPGLLLVHLSFRAWDSLRIWRTRSSKTSLNLGNRSSIQAPGLLQLVRRVVYRAVFSYAYAGESEFVIPAPIPCGVRPGVNARFNSLPVGVQLVEYPFSQFSVFCLNVKKSPRRRSVHRKTQRILRRCRPVRERTGLCDQSN